MHRCICHKLYTFLLLPDIQPVSQPVWGTCTQVVIGLLLFRRVLIYPLRGVWVPHTIVGRSHSLVVVHHTGLCSVPSIHAHDDDDGGGDDEYTTAGCLLDGTSSLTGSLIIILGKSSSSLCNRVTLQSFTGTLQIISANRRTYRHNSKTSTPLDVNYKHRHVYLNSSATCDHSFTWCLIIYTRYDLATCRNVFYESHGL